MLGAPGRSPGSEDTNVCSSRPGSAGAGHGPDRAGPGRVNPGHRGDHAAGPRHEPPQDARNNRRRTVEMTDGHQRQQPPLEVAGRRQQRLVGFDDRPAAAASIGQVHRGRWRTDGGQIVEVAVKVQSPGVGRALRSDLRQARLLARVMARLTRLNVSGLADELAGRIVEELDYVREGRVQTQVAAAFTRRIPEALAVARAEGGHEPPGRTSGTVPLLHAHTPRVLIPGWLEGASLSVLPGGRTDLLPAG